MNTYITQKQRKFGSHDVVVVSRIPFPVASICVCITPQLQLMVRQMAVIPDVMSQSRGTYVSFGIAASYFTLSFKKFSFHGVRYQ